MLLNDVLPGSLYYEFSVMQIVDTYNNITVHSMSTVCDFSHRHDRNIIEIRRSVTDIFLAYHLHSLFSRSCKI